ncbi:MAG: eukaryotic-like serine/threonine-protein kinase, partial [Solirubrobacteraceae bacterium]|nr:eukaryotic-like serine/threonine-protein kinase [Solirubrobacteraceae bacterium]
MATVVLAEDMLLGRQVALKRVTATADARDISRLRREALVGASVSHQNLVSIYDVVTAEDGNVVIVMEYVPGETLADALSREGRLASSEALRILDGVAAGLDAIHQRDIVHRDVKPANVLLGASGTVKLADLGVAAVADRTRITSAGAVVGSWRYMAPEQLEDRPSTTAIDVYALAAVAFEVLSGQKARREQNPMALAHAITTQPPPDLRDAWPEAPPGVAELLALAMAR